MCNSLTEQRAEEGKYASHETESKPKAKSIDKTRDINSIKNIKHSEVVVTHVPLSQQAKESPFKHKSPCL